MEETKKKNNKVLIGIIGILLVAALVVGYFYFNKNECSKSSKEKFTNSIEKLFKQEGKFTNVDFNTLAAKFDLKAKVTSPMLDSNILDIINKLGIKGEFDLDKKDNSVRFNLDSKYDGDELINLKTYVKEDTVYMFFDGIYDKWLKQTMEDSTKIDFSELDAVKDSFDEFEKVSDELVDVLKGSLKDKYFEEEKTDDGVKITLTLDKNNIKNITNDLLDGIKDSKEFGNLYKEMTNSDLKNDIKMIKQELENEDVFASIGDDFKATLTVYLNKKNEAEKVVFKVKTDDTDIGFELKAIDKNTVSLTVSTNGMDIVTAKIKEETKGNDTKFNISVSMMGLLEIELDGTYSVEYDKKLDKIDVDKAVKVDDLNETELNTIGTKFTTNKGMTKLMKALEKLDLSDLDLGGLSFDELEY